MIIRSGAPSLEFDYTLTPVPRTSDPTITSYPPFHDTELVLVDSAGAWLEWIISGSLGDKVSLESLSPSTATIVGDRVTRNGSGGDFSIRVTRGVAGKIFNGNNATSAMAFQVFDNYTENTLSRLLADTILNRIDEDKTGDYFSDFSGTGEPASVTPAASCWLHGVDVSAMALDGHVFIPASTANKGALITAQRLLGAAHWQSEFPYSAEHVGYLPGQTFRFRDSGGTIHSRTVVGVTRGSPDFAVATLDSPLPSGIKPLKLAGDWFLRNSEISADGRLDYLGGAVVWIDQKWKCWFMLGSTSTLSETVNLTLPFNGHTYTNIPLMLTFQSEGVVVHTAPSSLLGKTQFLKSGILGDSGSAICLLVHYDMPDRDELLLIGGFTYPTDAPMIGVKDGAIANDLIALADADAVDNARLGAATGLTVVVAPDPSL